MSDLRAKRKSAKGADAAKRNGVTSSRYRPIAANPAGLGRLARVFHLVGVASLPVMLGVDMSIFSTAWAQTAPRIPVTALPTAPTTESGAPISYQVNGNNATITQDAQANIVNWKSFDIGSAAGVNIVQPSSTAVLLNKVDGGAYLNQTTIDGMLNANGRVYIYNPNGIIFGNTATVNVNTLIASSLKFDESRVIGGLLLPGATPVLGADDPNYAGVHGDVQVEGDGSGRATLNANNGGLILLAAPTVVNNGLLNAPDGQVILAAGSKVYLAAPPAGQTALRGLLVEVCNEPVSCSTLPSSSTGASLAENGETGQIRVGQGNATMIGYAVNQNGLISATTSVNLNGSIHLYARDQATLADGSGPAKRTGNLVLGANSVTEVLPMLSDTSTVSAKTTFNKSEVDLSGANIELQENAKITAPGGNVTIKAETLPKDDSVIIDPATDTASRIDFAPGSLIDVSGSNGTQLSMESNVITVDLRGNELADNVLLRDSSLYGTRVQVDIRKGAPIANISGWLDLIQYNLGQLNAAGGTVNLSADGAIIQRAGSLINVDGGWVDYQSGHVNTTQLQALNGNLVDIGSAAANTLYTAAVSLPDSPDNFELGYRQGSSAGTVQFSAPIVVQQGDLSGLATAGPWQRDVTVVDSWHSVTTSAGVSIPITRVVFGYPQGGQLKIGNVNDSLVNPVTGQIKLTDQTSPTGPGVTSNQFVYTGNLLLGGTATDSAVPPDVGAAFDLSNADQRLLATSLNLDPAALALDGFSRISVLTSGNIDVTAPVALAPGGHLWLGAGQSQMSDVPGGDIAFNAPVTIPGGSVTAAASGTLLVADNPHAQGSGMWGFDLAGTWSNDQPLTLPAVDAMGNPVSTVVLKGGALNLAAKELTLGSDVSIDVSAGAWLNAQDKITKGSAGSIALQAVPPVSEYPLDAVLHLGSGLSLSGYGFSSGGSLKLVGRNVSIGAPAPYADDDNLWLQPDFFQQGGFTSYDIGANSNFEVQANTLVQPRALSWLLEPQSNLLPSGSMDSVATPHLFDLSAPAGASTRPATSLTFRANPCKSISSPDCAGMLVVNDGARLLLDPGANLNLYAGRQLTELGTLNAPGGNITLGLSSAVILPGISNSIWFGPNAQVLATGSMQRIYTNGDGVSSGVLLDGGSIQIGGVGFGADGLRLPADGYVIAEYGSMFDVSGVGASAMSFKADGALTPPQSVASSGGSIAIRASEGLLFEGDLRGTAGGLGAQGGSLSVTLDMGHYRSDGDILTILPNTISNTNTRYINYIIPPNLQPGDPIIFNKILHPGSDNEQDLGWFLTGVYTDAYSDFAGQGWLSTYSFESGGFGTLDFKSQDAIAFGLGSSDLTLSARDTLILDAPNLRAFNDSENKTLEDADGDAVSHTLILSAPFIQLGNADPNYQEPGASSTGIGQLQADGTTIDLIGNSALQGFSAANLNAAADIRLIGFDATDASGYGTGYTQGSLAMVGNLTLTDAQTYPTTLSDYTFMVAGDGADPASGTMTFVSNGNTPQQALSAAGSLTVVAPHILQAGQVVAPFGLITLGNVDSTPLSGTRSTEDEPIPSPNNPVLFGSILLDNLYFPGNLDNVPVSQPIITADLEYLPGSVTSVAGSGVVPFGRVDNGSVPSDSSWLYSSLVQFVLDPTGSIGSSGLPERALPAKAIVSHAQTIEADSGSVQDLSGGGSLLAYEFTAGKGGSKNVLDSSTTFAINPNYQGSVAPVDGEFGNGGLQPGDSVYLSGVPGLPAGTYTLLPAHYALLPGGFSIKAAPNTRDMQPAANVVLPDGTELVAGSSTAAGFGLGGSTRSNGFILASGAVVSKQSEFTLYDASTYFADKALASGVSRPELPIDGGYIAFDVTGTNASALAFDSTVDLAAATGDVINPLFNNTTWTGAIDLATAVDGWAGIADFSAPQIEVVSDSQQGTTGAVKLVAGDLTALGAESLLLGGLRETINGGTQLVTPHTLNKTTPSNVTLSNDAQHPLSGAEVLLVANNGITLDQGAFLQGNGTMGRDPLDLTLDGSGALVRVSGSGQVALTRNDQATSSGRLVVADSATVSASGSAILDATAGTTLDGQLDMAAGSALYLGSPGISLGSAIPGELPLTSLQLSPDLQVMLNTLSDLVINSYAATIDLYGTVNLGSSAMHSLSFLGAGFNGQDSTTDLVATSVSFSGAGSGAAPAPSAANNGQLTVEATSVEIGSDAFAIHGFADSTLTALGEVTATGTAGQLLVDHNLTLAAGQIDTASGADAKFSAGGDMTLTRVSNPLAPVSAAGMGGQLEFAAASLTSDAQILAPSGKVGMSAANGVDITGGMISAAGNGVSFGSTIAYAPGGAIQLQGGEVTVASPATLDVSAVGAAAGTLSIAASNAEGSGTAQLLGTLQGGATAGIDGVVPTQGQFVLVADQGGDTGFGDLNAQLNAAGFTESRQFEFHTGDVTLGGKDNITAHQLVIAADNGNISIGGNAVIDAAGAKGGNIALYASQATAAGTDGKVTLTGNASLLANATSVAASDAGSVGNGGSVLISSGSADGLAPTGNKSGSSINLLGGSIDVGGSSEERNGTVTLRAPRVGADGGSDVAIGSLNTGIANSSATVIEAYKVYQAATISESPDSATNLNATSTGHMYTEADSFSANKASILSRLKSGAATSLALRPGIEVRAPGDLTVSVNEFAAKAADRGWNLDAWRFDGQPVNLTLRAAGNLSILGSISDGFVNPNIPPTVFSPAPVVPPVPDPSLMLLAMPDWQLDTGPSASLQLSAGANLAAANSLTVNAGTGDVVFGFANRTPTSAAPLTNTDAPVALVRTGTGSIDVAAGRDVTLGMANFFVNRSSDPAVDGTPVLYDSVAPFTGVYQVTLYGAALYTAGAATSLPNPLLFTAPQDQLNTHYGAAAPTKTKAGTMSSAVFGADGGAITVNAGRDVNGPKNSGAVTYYRNADGQAAVPYDPDYPDYPAEPAIPGTIVMLPATVPQMVNDWLFRQGRTYVDAQGNVVFETLSNGTTLNTAWWSRSDYFNAGIATLGGGDVSVTASSNVNNLSASVASNAYMAGSSPSTLTEHGGGDLLVHTGGDIRGGSYYVQKGDATLRADGSVAAGDFVPTPNAAGAATLNPVLALGDAVVNVTAGHSLAIETAYNPMLTEQSVNNVDSVTAHSPALNPIYGVITAGSPEWDVTNTTSRAIAYRDYYSQFSNFSTYTDTSAVKLTAVGGDLSLSNDAAALAAGGSLSDVPNRFANQYGNSFQNLYLIEPATFSAAALSGDLTSANRFSMMPAPLGQLDLLAAGTLRLGDGATSAVRPDIFMMDNNPDLMSNAGAPRLFSQADINVLNGTVSKTTPQIAFHTLGGLHAADAEPVRLIALNGDIVGDGSNAATVSLPKYAEILAGRDIVDLGFTIQHNNASDVTTIVAGRDFIETSTPSPGLPYDDNLQMKNIVTGPGRIDISAGRNVDFGNRGGLVTRGNLDNPYLPAGGAGINVVAGAQPDYANFVNWLGSYGSAYSVIDVSVAPTAQQQRDLIAYVRSQKPDLPDSLTAAGALDAFWTLSDGQQRSFLDMNQDQWGANLELIAFVRATQADQPASQRATTAAAALDVFRNLAADQQQPLLASNQFVADFMDMAQFVARSEQADLVAYIQSVQSSLSVGLTPADALLAFGRLSTVLQNDFLIRYANTSDLAAYVRSLKPEMTLTLTDSGARAAFATLTTAQQSSFLDAHTDIQALLGSTASVENTWSAFSALAQADQQQFRDAHPDVVVRLAAGAARLDAALGVVPDYATLAIQDMQDLRDAVNNALPVSASLPASASSEQVWSAFRTLSQADQSLFLNGHPDVVSSLAERAAQLSTEQVAALAQANKSQLNASFFSSLFEASKQSNLGDFDRLIAQLFPTAATANDLVAYMRALQPELPASLTPAVALADFNLLAADQQQPFLATHTPDSLANMAMESGNIGVYTSQIKTEQGGDINLFTPTGSVYAGLTLIPPPSAQSNKGIFTISGGAVGSLVKNDFLVNQGRVFTLAGGDITLVSQYGSIDAGKGAKTASSAPPPLITVDGNGNIKVDVSSSISGSGIGTLQTHPDLPAANVYAAAPRGIFNAGDAGVRSSGNVIINAAIVQNANNITAAGAISGAPTEVAVPALGNLAPPSSASSSADDISKSLANANGSGGNAALNVEVVGFGGDNAAPNAEPGASPDQECSADADECDKNKRKKKI